MFDLFVDYLLGIDNYEDRIDIDWNDALILPINWTYVWLLQVEKKSEIQIFMKKNDDLPICLMI